MQFENAKTDLDYFLSSLTPNQIPVAFHILIWSVWSDITYGPLHLCFHAAFQTFL